LYGWLVVTHTDLFVFQLSQSFSQQNNERG